MLPKQLRATFTLRSVSQESLCLASSQACRWQGQELIQAGLDIAVTTLLFRSCAR
jgi:hypothetical protein